MSITISKGIGYQDGKPLRFVKSPNVGGKLVPEYIVIHDTASGLKDDGDVSWLTDKRSKVSAHVVVSREGRITQLVPFNIRAWHAGESVWQGRRYLNGFAIGIEIDNPGKLAKVSDGVYRNSVVTIDTNKNPSLIVKYAKTAVHGAGYWLMYTDEQIKAVEELCRAICSTYQIKDIITHWMISPGRKIDTNPLYPLDDLRASVLGFRPAAFAAMPAGDDHGPDTDESGDADVSLPPDGPQDESAGGAKGALDFIKTKWASGALGGLTVSSVIGFLSDWRVIVALGGVGLLGFIVWRWSRKQ